MTRGSGTGVECGEGRGGGWQGEGAEEEGGSVGGGGERGGEGAQGWAAHRTGAAAMLRAQSGPAGPGAGCRHRCAAGAGPGSGPRLTALASGQRPATAEIARAVREGRFAAGPAGPGMPQLPAEEERGARAGAPQRRGAGRTGGAGSSGPASPGAVGRAGPEQRHGERCACVRSCSEGCLRGRKIRVRERRSLALCRALD